MSEKDTRDTLLYLFTICLLPAQIFSDTWVISTLWGWFMVPLGAPAISMVVVFAFQLMHLIVVFNPKREGPDDGLEAVTHRLQNIGHTWFAFGLGALAYWWLG